MVMRDCVADFLVINPSGVNSSRGGIAQLTFLRGRPHSKLNDIRLLRKTTKQTIKNS